MKESVKKKLDVVINIFLVIAIVVLLATFIFRQTYLSVTVEGNSMNPTIENLEMGYMKKVNSKTKINRFDIVAVDMSATKGTDTLWIKRVVGLPYEKVEIKGNELYINGALVPQTFSILGDTSRYDCSYTLENEYLIAGDNRQTSVLATIITKDQIKAKNGFIYRQCVSYDDTTNVCSVKGDRKWKKL